MISLTRTLIWLVALVSLTVPLLFFPPIFNPCPSQKICVHLWTYLLSWRKLNELVNRSIRWTRIRVVYAKIISRTTLRSPVQHNTCLHYTALKSTIISSKCQKSDVSRMKRPNICSLRNQTIGKDSRSGAIIHNWDNGGECGGWSKGEVLLSIRMSKTCLGDLILIISLP